MPSHQHIPEHGPHCLHCVAGPAIQKFLDDNPQKCQACIAMELAMRVGELVGGFAPTNASLLEGIAAVNKVIAHHATRAFKP